MNQHLRRLGAALLGALAFMALASTFWGVIARDRLLARPDNPRLVLAEQRIQRGMIVDRYGVPLAYTRDEDGDGLVERVYAWPEAAFATGYYSLRYGATGAESLADAHLRGDALLSPREQYSRQLMNQDQAGGDVQLTIDSGLQRALDQALAGRRGAIVVLDSDNGDILAMVSSPRYDPNTLDADWDFLREDANAPLLNRALQGQYQPGAALEPLLLATAINAGLATPGDLAAPVGAAVVESHTLPCGVDYLAARSLGESLVAACPAPFGPLAERLGEERLRTMLIDFGLEDQIGALLGGALDGEVSSGGAVAIDAALLGIGQSDYTVSPLEMARIASALGERGVIPPVRLIRATRPPESIEWTEAPAQGATRGTISQAALNAIQDLMHASARNGAAQFAAVEGLAIYGHGGLALSGPEGELLAWFIGSVRADEQGYAVAVLVEEASGVAEAGKIAAVAFERLPRE